MVGPSLLGEAQPILTRIKAPRFGSKNVVNLQNAPWGNWFSYGFCCCGHIVSARKCPQRHVSKSRYDFCLKSPIQPLPKKQSKTKPSRVLANAIFGTGNSHMINSNSIFSLLIRLLFFACRERSCRNIKMHKCRYLYSYRVVSNMNSEDRVGRLSLCLFHAFSNFLLLELIAERS